MVEVFATGDSSGVTDTVNVQAALNRVDDFSLRLRGNPFYFNDWLQPLPSLPRKAQGDGVDVQALIWVGSATRRGFFCPMNDQSYAIDLSDFSAATFGAGGVLIDVSHPYTLSHREPALRVARVQQQLGDPSQHWWDYLIRMNNTWRADLSHIEGVGPDDQQAVHDGTKMKATVQALGRCVGGHIRSVNATNVYRHIEVLGEASEGWVIEHCNAPLCRDGYVIERQVVAPGLLLLNCHADAWRLPISIKGVAQFDVLMCNLYRRPADQWAQRWDAVSMAGGSQDGSVIGCKFVNNGPADGLAYGAVVYDAFNVVLQANRPGGVHDGIRLEPQADLVTVMGNRGTNITGQLVRNLTPWTGPPHIRIEGND